MFIYQVMIGYKKPAYHYPKGSLKKLTRLASHGKVRSVARFILKDLSMKKQVIIEVGKVIKNELKLFCSNKFDSILVETSQAALQFFTWESMWEEMAKATPFLLSILQSCMSKQAKIERLKAVICMCFAILAKFRNPRLCLVQSMMSMILLAEHASKNVSVHTSIV